MDEPSTGLDPASRSTLWNVVKRAKQDKAIILTSTTTTPTLSDLSNNECFKLIKFPLGLVVLIPITMLA
jgi:ABC-type multidrug transport system ATPase subunit